MDNALPLEISETYDEDGNGTLESVIQELLYRFNITHLIEEAERTLMGYRGEQYGVMSERSIGVFARVTWI